MPHRTRAIVCLLVLLLLVANCGSTGQESARVAHSPMPPPPTSTPIPPTATPTPLPTSPPTSTATPVPTGTPTAEPTATAAPTDSPTPAPTATPTSEPSIPLSDLPLWEPDICHFTTPYGYEVECGYLVVPEHRSKPDTRPIRVHAAVFKSRAAEPKPDPVIYVAGGGGVNQLGMAESYLSRVGNDILEARDFIMYNQRGAYLDEPSLACPDDTTLIRSWAAQGLSARERDDRQIERQFECYDDLLAEGADLSGYNTVETAGDVNDLRIALGYDQVNLYGTSSGTRTILAILRLYPEGVRSAILDSVDPPQVNLYTEYPHVVDRVFSLVFEECAADPECKQKYPDLEALFFQTVDDLDANPVSVQIDGTRIPINGGLFMDALWHSLYMNSSVSQIPHWIESASNGDLSGLQGILAGVLSDTGNMIALGYEWSMQCNEEVAFESYEEARELAADLPPQIAHYFESYLEFTLCESWESGRADPVENEAVTSDIPSLVLAGQYDPITPPAWSRMAAETLSNHYYYEFPGLTHGIMRSDQCGLEIGLQFLDDPESEPDASCLEEYAGPTFW
mgnify:CR=1 FL=1